MIPSSPPGFKRPRPCPRRNFPEKQQGTDLRPYPDFSGQLIPIFRPTPRDTGGKVFPSHPERVLDSLRAIPPPRSPRPPAGQRGARGDASSGRSTRSAEMRPPAGQHGARGDASSGRSTRSARRRALRPVNTERAETRPPAGQHGARGNASSGRSTRSARRHEDTEIVFRRLSFKVGARFHFGTTAAEGPQFPDASRRAPRRLSGKTTAFR